MVRELEKKMSVNNFYILIILCLNSIEVKANNHQIDVVFTSIKNTVLINHQIINEEEWRKIQWKIVKDEDLIAEYDGDFTINIGNTVISKCNEFGLDADNILAHIIAHEFIHILEHRYNYRINKKVEAAQEIIADYEGILLAYIAGYEFKNINSMATFLIKNVKEAQKVSPQNRMENIQTSLDEIERVCIVYKASQLKYAQKEYDYCIEYLNLVKLPLRHTYIVDLINKNISICYIQKAIESFSFSSKEINYSLPLEFINIQRLKEGSHFQYTNSFENIYLRARRDDWLKKATNGLNKNSNDDMTLYLLELINYLKFIQTKDLKYAKAIKFSSDLHANQPSVYFPYITMLYALTNHTQNNSREALEILNNCSSCYSSPYYEYYKQLFVTNKSDESLLNLKLDPQIIESIPVSNCSLCSVPKSIGDIKVSGNNISIKNKQYQRVGLMKTTDNIEVMSLFRSNPFVKYYSTYFSQQILMIDEDKIELFSVR